MFESETITVLCTTPVIDTIESGLPIVAFVILTFPFWLYTNNSFVVNLGTSVETDCCQISAGYPLLIVTVASCFHITGEDVPFKLSIIVALFISAVVAAVVPSDASVTPVVSLSK